MDVIVMEIDSNEELFQLIDKRFDHIFIHKFNPHGVFEWSTANLKIGNLDIKGASVRHMQFDVQTNIEGLRKFTKLNTNYLSVYQFEKAVADTLVLENLHENSKEKILFHNGLKHIFSIDFEVLTIESNDENFINSIRNNPIFSVRIEEFRIKFRPINFETHK
jgi:hypothetical protein